MNNYKFNSLEINEKEKKTKKENNILENEKENNSPVDYFQNDNSELGLYIKSLYSTNNEEKTTKDDYNIGNDLAYFFASARVGFRGFLEGIYDFVGGTIAKMQGDEEKQKKLLSESWTRDLQEEITKKYNPSKAGEFFGSVMAGVGQNALPLAISALGGPIGMALAAATFGLSAGGNYWQESYEKLKAQGREDEGIGALGYTYGIIGGVVESAMELLSGATFNIARRVQKGGIQVAAKAVVREGLFKTMLKDGAGEFFEESVGNILMSGVEKAMGIDKEKLNLKNATEILKDSFYQGLVGFVSGALMSGGTGSLNNVNHARIGAKVKDTNALINNANIINESITEQINSTNDPNIIKTLDENAKAIKATSDAIKEIVAKKDIKLDEKSTFKLNILKGELSVALGRIEITKAFQESKETFINGLNEETLKVLNLNPEAEDFQQKIHEYALMDFVNKLIIPMDEQMKFINRGYVLGGYSQFAQFINRLNEEQANEIKNILGFDIRKTPLDKVLSRLNEIKNNSILNEKDLKIISKIEKATTQDKKLGLFDSVVINKNNKKTEIEVDKIEDIRELKNGEYAAYVSEKTGLKFLVFKNEKGYKISIQNQEGRYVEINGIISNTEKLKKLIFKLENIKLKTEQNKNEQLFLEEQKEIKEINKKEIKKEEEKKLKEDKHLNKKQKIEYSFEYKDINSEENNTKTYTYNEVLDIANKNFKGLNSLSTKERQQAIRIIKNLVENKVKEDVATTIARFSIMRKVDMSFEMQEKNIKGMFTYENNKPIVYINPKKVLDIKNIVIHEFMHSAENQENYKDFREYVKKNFKDKWEKQYHFVKTTIKKMTPYKMTEEDIQKETLAYFMENTIGDIAFEKMNEKFTFKETNFIKNVIKYFKTFSEKIKKLNDPNYKEFNVLAEKYLKIINEKENTNKQIKTKKYFSLDLPGSENILKTDPNRKEPFNYKKASGKEIKIHTASQFKKFLEKAQIAFVNSQQAIENYIADALKTKKVKREQMTALIQAVRDSNGRADYMAGFNGAQYNMITGERMGDSLMKILEFTIDKNGKPTNEYEPFMLYLLHHHNIDRLKQNKPIFNENVTEEVSRKTIDDLEKSYPHFKEKAEKVWAYNNNLLKMELDANLITKELYEKLTATYPHYVPTMRDVSGNKATGVQRGNRFVKVNDNIKKATGSDLPILPLEEQMINNTKKAVNSILLNQLLNELYDLQKDTNIEIMSVLEEIKEEDNMLLNENPNEESEKIKLEKANSIITFKRNGNNIKVKVAENVWRGIDAFSTTSTNTFWFNSKILQSINRTFKSLVTSLNPFFIIRNFTKDSQDAALYSKFGAAEFGKAYAKAVSEMKNNGHYYEEFLAASGRSASYYTYDKGFTLHQNKLQKVLNKIEDMNNFIEFAPRLAEFILSREKGLSINEAMLNAHDVTVNFSKSGIIGKWLNSNFIPFLNPSIQGMSKLIRAFVVGDAAKGIASFIVRAILFGISLTVINDLMNRGNKHYKNVSMQDKQNYFIFDFNHDGKFFKLPKGRVSSVLGNAYLQMLKLKKYKENNMPYNVREEARDFFKFLGQQVTPFENIDRSIFSPLLDAKKNKTWYGSNIENSAMQNYKVEERYDERTSQIAIKLGKILHYSPKKIHYILDQYSGVIGDFVLPTTAKAKEDNAMIGVLKSNFQINSNSKNVYSNEFYNLHENIKQEYNSDNDNLDNKMLYNFSNKHKKVINDLLKERNKIVAMDNIGKKEKSERLEKVDKQLLEFRKNSIANVIAMKELLKNKKIKTTEDNYNIVLLQAYVKILGSEKAIKMLGKTQYEKYKKSKLHPDIYIKMLINHENKKKQKRKNAPKIHPIV